MWCENTGSEENKCGGGCPVAEIDVLRASVLAALAGGQSGSGVDMVGRVCRACVRLLPVDGAAVSVMADAGHREVVYTQ